MRTWTRTWRRTWSRTWTGASVGNVGKVTEASITVQNIMLVQGACMCHMLWRSQA